VKLDPAVLLSLTVWIQTNVSWLPPSFRLIQQKTALNCHGNVEDDFLEIDFLNEFAVADHISLTVREKGRFLGHCLRKNKSLVAIGS
jgi:hypothetical protein